MTFGSDFVWGVASSAYQIEGASAEDGRGPSVWDAYCRRPAAVLDGQDGDVACDHYHRWEEDVDLIADLGVGAYRFSISWPRVLPAGEGAVNERGLDFYDRLVDRLLERGVQPWITLFHWDLPLELFWRGGWLNAASADWFEAYTRIVVDRLSDRVRHWITLNEPQCYIGLGHGLKVHAPGLAYSRADLLRATHNTLLAHGRGVQAIRERAKTPAIVGWSPVGVVSYPTDDSVQAVDAARKAMFAIRPDLLSWTMNNVWYSDPVCLGRYPEEGLELFGRDVPRIGPRDLETIAQPLDFYGCNIYHGAPIALPVEGRHVDVAPRQRGYPQTQMGWTVDPACLYWGPRFLSERYGLPIHVTENGIATMDWLQVDGTVKDMARIDYAARHLIELRRARRDGIDVRGYFHWSIMDNFEWEYGYSKRFGLVYVDYRTLERVKKESYHWFRRVIESGGEALPETPRPLH